MYSIVFKYFGGKKVKSSRYVFKLVDKKGEMRVADCLLLPPQQVFARNQDSDLT